VVVKAVVFQLHYHRDLSTRSDLLVAVLTVWLAAGPLVLDQCPIGCHGELSTASSTATTVCHQTDHEDSGPLLQPAASCHHDHTVSSAETIAKTGSESPLKIVQPARGSHASSFLLTASTAVNLSATPPPGRATAAAFLRPLRV
jgi:hypothetical protein